MRIHTLLFYLLLVLFPTQAGRHFWPEWANVFGIRVDYLSPTLFLTDIILFLLFFFWLLEKPFKGLSLKGELLVFFTLIFLVISSFLAERPAPAFYNTLKLIEFCLLGLYVSKNVITKKQFTLVIFFLSLGVLWSSVLACAQFFSQSSLSALYLSTRPLLYSSLQLLGERTFDVTTPGIAKAVLDSRLVLRPYATFPHPNVLAGFTAVVLVLVITNLRMLTTKSSKLSIIVALATLLITFSRSAWVVWLLAISYWLLVREKKAFLGFLKKKKFVGALLLLLALFLGCHDSSVILNRFATLKTDDFLAISRRWELNKAALRMVRSSPIFGIGLGNFIPRLFGFSQNREVIYWLQPVHNIFLLVSAETGLVGLGIFLWFLSRTYKHLVINHPHQRRVRLGRKSIIITLSSTLALGFFDHYFLTLQQTQLLFSLLLGLCWVNLSDPGSKSEFTCRPIKTGG